MTDITQLLDQLSEIAKDMPDVDEMIVIAPKELANLLHDWICDQDDFNPEVEIDTIEGTYPRMVRHGDWINRDALLKEIPKLIERASDE